MEKKCVACKWFYKSTCNNKSVTSKIDFMNNAITYIEDGIFAEQIKESGVCNRIINKVISDLEKCEAIKKTKMKYLDHDSLAEDIEEIMDEELSAGIQNYFEVNKSNLIIDNPYEFKCVYWE